MSHAVAVSHGEFGRAALYLLDRTIITHAHREGHLIFYVEGAAARVMVANTLTVVDAGHFTAVSPWESHSFQLEEGASQLCLVLYIKPMWFLENTASAEYALQFGSPQPALDAEITKLVRRLTSFMLEKEDHVEFDQLLFGLTKASYVASWSCGQDPRLRGGSRHFGDHRVRRSTRMLQSHVGENIEMQDMARMVGLSRPHFFKLFKQYVGVTPNLYMNTLRSERAIDNLMTSDKTITDIAFELGFSSQASFTRFFSSNVGIAPSEYRRVAHVNGPSFPMK